MNKKKMAEEVKLFRTWSSPFALRIVWALQLKGVPYETIYEDLSNKSSLLLQYNPIHKKVPVLLHNGKPIVESFVILEYIEETWKESNPLLPEDPLGRATARFWAKFGDDKVLPSVWESVISEGAEQEEAIVKAKENLKYLEGELKGKRFFGGEKLGFADIMLGWLAHYITVFEDVTGKKLLTEEFPLLSAWAVIFADAPIIKDNLPSKEKLVAKFQAIREGFLSKKAPK